MNNDDQPGDPFGDYINASLDMEGIDGMEHLAIAEKVRRLLPTLPENVSPELWDEQLNHLQSVIRVCLDLDTVLGAFKEQPDSSNFTRDDLESLIMLSVTFAFISYNQLHAAYNEDETYHSDSTILARRLRAALQASLGWVRHAANDGDPIAERFTDEIAALLEASAHLK